MCNTSKIKGWRVQKRVLGHVSKDITLHPFRANTQLLLSVEVLMLISIDIDIAHN